MIYTLEVILALYGAAVIAIAAITIWGPGTPVFAPMASATTGKLRPPQLAAFFSSNVACWHFSDMPQ